MDDLFANWQAVSDSRRLSVRIGAKDAESLVNTRFGELTWLIAACEVAVAEFEQNTRSASAPHTPDSEPGSYKKNLRILNDLLVRLELAEVAEQVVVDNGLDAVKAYAAILSELREILCDGGVRVQAATKDATGRPPLKGAATPRGPAHRPGGGFGSPGGMSSPVSAAARRYGMNAVTSPGPTPRPLAGPFYAGAIAAPVATAASAGGAGAAAATAATPSKGLFGAVKTGIAYVTGSYTAEEVEEERRKHAAAKADLQIRLKESQEDVICMQQKFTYMQSQLKQTEAQLHSSNTEIAKLKQGYADMRDETSQAVRSVEQARQENVALREAKAALEGELREAQAAMGALHADLAAAREELQAASQRLQDVTATFESKLSSVSALDEERIASLQREADSRVTHSEQAAAASLAAQKEAAAALQTEIDAYRGTMDALQTQVQTLQEQVAAALSERDSAAEARAAAEAAVATAAAAADDRVKAAHERNVVMASRLQCALEELNTFRQEMRAMSSSAGEQVAAAQAEMAAMGRSLLSRVLAAQGAAADANTRYLREQAERRRLYNKLQEERGNIRVVARIRPLLPKEEEAAESAVIKATSPHELMVAECSAEEGGRGRAMDSKGFEFDRVLGAEATQADVFDEVCPLVTSALDGFHACIFAYGQTGSGKTHTMQGTAANPGVYYRALDELFDQIASRRGVLRYECKATMVEIYNEAVMDLLGDKPAAEAYAHSDEEGSASLDIKQGPHGNYLPGATVVPVSDKAAVESIMTKGALNRTVGRTNANEHSSRSHSLLMIDITGVNTLTGAETQGKLVLVDLAGSERVSKSGAEGTRLKEAQNINKSLSALGDVIAALVAKEKHIPFRNSKLTYLLQDSLSKDNKTLMIVQVSPVTASRGESLCSLMFASRVRRVELGKAQKHVDNSAEVQKLRAEVKRAQEVARGAEEAALALKERLDTAVEAEKRATAQAAELNAALAQAQKQLAAPGGNKGLEEATASLAASQEECEALRQELAAAKAAAKESVRAAKATAEATTKVALEAAVKKATEDTTAKLRAAQAEAVKKAVSEAKDKDAVEAKKAVAEAEERARVEADKVLSTLRKQVKDLQAALERADNKAKAEVQAAVQAAKIAWERERVRTARTARSTTTGSTTASAAASTAASATSSAAVSRKSSLAPAAFAAALNSTQTIGGSGGVAATPGAVAASSAAGGVGSAGEAFDTTVRETRNLLEELREKLGSAASTVPAAAVTAAVADEEAVEAEEAPAAAAAEEEEDEDGYDGTSSIIDFDETEEDGPLNMSALISGALNSSAVSVGGTSEVAVPEAPAAATPVAAAAAAEAAPATPPTADVSAATPAPRQPTPFHGKQPAADAEEEQEAGAESAGESAADTSVLASSAVALSSSALFGTASAVAATPQAASAVKAAPGSTTAVGVGPRGLAGKLGSRERARLAGMPSPKPIGILKRKAEVPLPAAEAQAASEAAAPSAAAATVSDAAASTEAAQPQEQPQTRRKRARVALLSPESQQVHMARSTEEEDAAAAATAAATAAAAAKENVAATEGKVAAVATAATAPTAPLSATKAARPTSRGRGASASAASAASENAAPAVSSTSRSVTAFSRTAPKSPAASSRVLGDISNDATLHAASAAATAACATAATASSFGLSGTIKPLPASAMGSSILAGLKRSAAPLPLATEPSAAKRVKASSGPARVPVKPTPPASKPAATLARVR